MSAPISCAACLTTASEFECCSGPRTTTNAVEGLGVERAYGDIRDLEATRQAIAGCHRVYHTAALVSTIDGDDAHRRDVFESNVIGTRNVLQAAREHGSWTRRGYRLV